MKQFSIKGYQFNIIFFLYLLFIAPLLKDAIISGETNYIFGFIGLLIYLLEPIFLKVKTIFVLKRFLVSNQKMVDLSIPNYKKPTLGYFIWFMTIMRFLFRLGILVISIHLIGVADVLKENDIGWVGGLLLCLFVIFELIILMDYTSLIDYVITDKESLENQKEMITAKWTKLQKNKYWFMRNEWIADSILFVYSAILYTGFWDILQSELINDVNLFYKEGYSVVYTLFAIISGYSILCFIALVPVRLAYWIEETLCVFNKKQMWRLRVSFLIVAISFAYPVLVRIFELYISR